MPQTVTMSQAVILVLAGNAILAFAIMFPLQLLAILTLQYGPDRRAWRAEFGEAWRNPDQWRQSVRERRSQFARGEIAPRLRRAWLCAVAYVVLSFAALFTAAALGSLATARQGAGL